MEDMAGSDEGMDISLLLANVIGPEPLTCSLSQLACILGTRLPEAYPEPTRLAGRGGQGCALQSARGHMPRALHRPLTGCVALEDLHPFCF